MSFTTEFLQNARVTTMSLPGFTRSDICTGVTPVLIPPLHFLLPVEDRMVGGLASLLHKPGKTIILKLGNLMLIYIFKDWLALSF